MMHTKDYRQEILRLLEQNLSVGETAERLDNYHDRDIACCLAELNERQRQRLFRCLSGERLGEVLSFTEQPEQYIAELSEHKAADALESMEADEALEVLSQFETEEQQKLISLMDRESREDIRLISSYDEDSIGSHMTTNFIVIQDSFSVRDAMKALVAQAADNDNVSTLYVTNSEGKYCGAVELTDLIVARDTTPLNTLVMSSYPAIYATQQLEDCLPQLMDYEEDSIPVLDAEDRLIGVITAQDIAQITDEQLGEDYVRLAGLTEEETLHEPLLKSVQKRMPWLLILLALGLLVSGVVSVFERVMQTLAIVVCFQSLILDMAGNVGTQSLGVTIRILTDHKLPARTRIGLIFKEMRVGLTNGVVLGTISFVTVGLYIWLIRGEMPSFAFSVSACLGFAMLIAMLISGFFGSAIPIFLDRLGFDSAVASGPLITTVNDLAAVVTYYGLCWIFLLGVLGLG